MGENTLGIGQMRGKNFGRQLICLVENFTGERFLMAKKLKNKGVTTALPLNIGHASSPLWDRRIVSHTEHPVRRSIGYRIYQTGIVN